MTNQNEIRAWAKNNTWQFKMDNSKGLDSHDNYSGSMEHPDWVVVVGRNRDSDILTNSNFDCALEQLGGEGKSVEVVSFGHWGCGWFELILVNPKTKTKLAKAYEIMQSLENYPVLDENDFYEREAQERDDNFNCYKSEFKQEILKFIGSKANLRPARDAMVERIADYVYSEDCGYCGNEDAWVSSESIRRFVESYEFKDFENTLIGRALKLASSK